MRNLAPVGLIVASLLLGGCSSAATPSSSQQNQGTLEASQGVPATVSPTNKPVEQWKFYNQDGSFQTAQEVRRAAAASPDLRSNIKALDAIFAHAESAINYVADQKTTVDATGKTADQVTLDDYRMVTKEYQALILGTLVRGNGQLKDLLYTAAADTTNARFSHDGYRMAIRQDFVDSQTLTITDNAEQVGATGEAARALGVYRVISRSGDDVSVPERPANADPSTYIASYTVDGAIGLAKKTK